MVYSRRSVIVAVIPLQVSLLVNDHKIRFTIRAALTLMAAVCLLVVCNQNHRTEILSGKGDMLTYIQGWPLTHVQLTEFAGNGDGAMMVANGWPDYPFASIQCGRFLLNFAIWLTILVGLPTIVEYAFLLWKRRIQSTKRSSENLNLMR
jgi:hypothetical protein